MSSFRNCFMNSATSSRWDNPQLRSNAVLFLDCTRVELAKSKLGLNWTLAVLMLLSIIPAVLLHIWVSSGRKLPPSPRGLPIIGHLHLLGTHAHMSMAQLSQKYGPVMYLKLGSQHALVISSPEHAKEVFKNHDLTFSERPKLIVLDLLVTNKQGISFQSMNPSWRNLRKIFTMELLSPKRLQEWQPVRTRELNSMLTSIFEQSNKHPNSPMEIKAKLWVLTTNITSEMILSKRYFSDEEEEESEEAKEFKYVMEEMLNLVGSIFPADCLPFLKWLDLGGFEKRTKKLYPRLQNILTKILSERRAQRKQRGESYVDVDLLDVLLTQQEKGGDVPVTEGNIRGVVWDGFAGGTDTQLAAMEWVMAHLLNDPGAMEKVKTELETVVGIERKVEEKDIPCLKYLEAVVKETFRLHPPVPLLVPRESTQECSIAGFVVPAETRLFINVYAIGRDARVWPDPLKFQPQRFLQQHDHVDLYGQYPELMPFGTGRRICPAANMGILHVSMFVASLIHAFDWSLPEGVLDMAEAVGITPPMAPPLRAIPSPRLPRNLYYPACP
uniref:Flavonoid 3',5'-hydroxylase n=1 Tax=Pohlia nutans TaxID=140635 RepID=W5XRP2_9BRYO|nr:flavonoid 3',5'-hydroxylase [Pohlia nutans]